MTSGFVARRRRRKWGIRLDWVQVTTAQVNTPKWGKRGKVGIPRLAGGNCMKEKELAKVGTAYGRKSGKNEPKAPGGAYRVSPAQGPAR
jgi:hypothetical protein